MAHIVMARIVMAYIVMAHIVMAHIVVDYIVVAYTVVAYKLMAYIAYGLRNKFVSRGTSDVSEHVQSTAILIIIFTCPVNAKESFGHNISCHCGTSRARRERRKNIEQPQPPKFDGHDFRCNRQNRSMSRCDHARKNKLCPEPTRHDAISLWSRKL